MENYPIKSVAFGGFDKQDVINYIEKTSREAAQAQKELTEENARLRLDLTALEQEAAQLREKVAAAEEEKRQLHEALNDEKAARQALEELKPLECETERLKSEIETLRPDAESFARFRERIGAIECEARKRAADLEAATAMQMRQTLDQFRSQYQLAMNTFTTTAAHVTSELRKIEVNLTQLPRAMDQNSTELNALAAILEKESSKETE